MNRRSFLAAVALAPLAPLGCSPHPAGMRQFRSAAEADRLCTMKNWTFSYSDGDIRWLDKNRGILDMGHPSTKRAFGIKT